MIELLAGLVLSLTAAVVGVWQVTKRDKPLHGPRDDGTLGLPRLQRWDASYQPPRMQRIRSRFPRVEISRLVIVACLLVGLTAGAAFWYSRNTSRTASQQEAFASSLGAVSTLRQQAAATRSQTEAYALLQRADDQLDDLAQLSTSDADRSAVATEAAALASELERITNVVKLSSVQVVGTFPHAPSSIEPQLVAGGGATYLLSDAVYQVEPASATLVRLLGEGDTLNGDAEPVGRIIALAWRDNVLVALDPQRAYSFEPGSGNWTIEPLAELDASGYVDVTAAETFDRNLYLLTPGSGQILKFSAGIYDSTPEDWNGSVAREDLQHAVDLAINGHVYVALDDGRILDFFRARLESTFEPKVLPPIARASSIVVPAGAADGEAEGEGGNQLLYILSEADGRILRVGADGRLIQQLVPPAAVQMTGATDMTVDEASGIALVISQNTLYLLRLPAAPTNETPQRSPTPEPPPQP